MQKFFLPVLVFAPIVMVLSVLATAIYLFYIEPRQGTSLSQNSASSSSLPEINGRAGDEAGNILSVAEVAGNPDAYLGKEIRIRGKINIKILNGAGGNPAMSLISPNDPEKTLALYRSLFEGDNERYEPISCNNSGDGQLDCGKICGQFEDNSMLTISAKMIKEQNIYFLVIHSSSSTSH